MAYFDAEQKRGKKGKEGGRLERKAERERCGMKIEKKRVKQRGRDGEESTETVRQLEKDSQGEKKRDRQHTYSKAEHFESGTPHQCVLNKQDCVC